MFDQYFKPTVLSDLPDEKGFVLSKEAHDYAKQVIEVIEFAKLHDPRGKPHPI